jgi:hypothetical protein
MNTEIKNPRQKRYALLKDAAWLYRQYVKCRRSMDDIASEVGCFKNAVKNALRQSGIPIRRYTVTAAALEARKLGGSTKRIKKSWGIKNENVQTPARGDSG